MELRPILSALRRHKTAAAVIVLEIALSCAIVCNALFLIGSRLERMDRPSGIAEDTLVRLQVVGAGQGDNDAALTATDLAAFRALPGVVAAEAVNQAPFWNSSWNSSVNLEEDQSFPTLNATTYLAGPQMLETFDLQLVAGRDFNADEFVEWDAFSAPNSDVGLPAAVITTSMVQAMWPDAAPAEVVGRQFYSWGPTPIRVVGVVERLVRPNDVGGATDYEFAMLLPVNVPYSLGGNYLIRVDDPARRAEVLAAAKEIVLRNDPSRIVLDENSMTVEQMRNDYYREDRAMAWLLVAVIVALLVVTALGIVGLASFWVAQRTKQIGVRRALGATRSQILRYFQTENFLLATIGIVLGMLLAYGINQLLMERYELPRLPALYLPIGAVALWLLGQVAVFGPARRAAAVPPAVATRSV
ncbi:MAG TPA: FtsX-like permease family protein [Xanthomonadaceae bacterium]|nr:FtsX-like permease family protein [Xanthomonadaceae bacterium]